MVRFQLNTIGRQAEIIFSYPKLSFDPFALFGLGAPIGLLLALRGVEHLGPEYVLPSCRKFLNIFHPYDPFAYRIEPYILDFGAPVPKPVQIPHHAGRKRLHLEIADNLGKAAEAAKAGLLRSMRSGTIQPSGRFFP